MNPSFVLVLKSERVYRYKQNRQLSFLVNRDTKIVKVKAKRGIPVTKFKSQIILMKKNGLNVEHFRYHITINYDKLHQHALINQMLYQKKIIIICDLSALAAWSLL